MLCLKVLILSHIKLENQPKDENLENKMLLHLIISELDTFIDQVSQSEKG